MWSDALNIAISNGIFATLFVCLLIYELKDSRKREKKYQTTIDNLNKSLGSVNDISKNLKDVKDEVCVIENDVQVIKTDVSNIKRDVSELKSGVENIKKEVTDLKPKKRCKLAENNKNAA
mgnify:CR=1 FL=1